MSLAKGLEVKGIVTKVENHGLYLDLTNEELGYLPKEAMNIAKNKKLVDVFSEGFVIIAKIVNKKDNYYTLTQKNIEIKKENKIDDVVDRKEQSIKKDNSEKKKKQNASKKKQLENKTTIDAKKIEEIKTEKEKTNPTLAELSKLKNFGNIKISVSKNKEQKFKEKIEVQEEKQFLEVPENFVINLEKTFEDSKQDIKKIKKRLQERGYLGEN